MAKTPVFGAVDKDGFHYHDAVTGLNPFSACKVADKDYHFLINPIDRSINPYPDSSENAPNATNKIKIMQYDHNSEVFTIELPRWVEGHDMLRCNRIEVHFLNIGDAGTNEGIHLIDTDTITKIAGDAERIMFSWPISMAATQYVGTLSFAIRFACAEPAKSVDADEAELLYAWNTLPYNKIQVGKSINNTDVVLEKYQDILSQWEYKLGIGVKSVKQTTKSLVSGGTNVITVTLTDGRTSTFEILNGLSPKKGVDYWTAADKAEILKYIYDNIPIAEEAEF